MVVVPPQPPIPPFTLPDAEGKRHDTVLKDSAATARILALTDKVAELEKLLKEGAPNRTPPKVDDVPPPPKESGPDLPPVPKVSQDDVAKAVAAWMSVNGKSLKGNDGSNGRDGIDGKPGKAGETGTVTVILIGADGKEISRATAQAGSIVKLSTKQFLTSK